MSEEKKYQEIEVPRESGTSEPVMLDTDAGSMSLIAHLTELRSRLIKIVVAVARVAAAHEFAAFAPQRAPSSRFGSRPNGDRPTG